MPTTGRMVRRRSAPPLALVLVLLAVAAGVTGAAPGASATTRAAATEVRWWLSTADGTLRLAPREPIRWGAARRTALPVVVVDAAQRHQRIRGFGASLTESSAGLLAALPAPARDEVLRTLFDPVEGLGLSFLRQPLGATDFSTSSWTPGDQPGAFSLDRDRQAVLPLLREARRLNPALQVLLTAWTAPAWMKTNGHLHGGSLRPDAVPAYVAYLVEAVRAHRAEGVPVEALTLVNEPGHETGAYPSMAMGAAQAADVARQLVPALRAAGLPTRVYAHDHNWDGTAEALAVLSDPLAGPALAGTAFHCYAGEPSAQSLVHAAHPDKEILITECSGGGWSTDHGANLAWGVRNLLIDGLRHWASAVVLWNLAGPALAGTAFHCYAGEPSAQSLVHAAHPDKEILITECSGGGWSTDHGANLAWGVRNLLIDGLRHWASAVVLWNLALDPASGPQNGGCTDCRGVLTIDPSRGTVVRNVEHEVLGHLSRFARPGAHRIASTDHGRGSIGTVALVNPDGGRVLLALNGAPGPRSFVLREGGRQVTLTLPPGGVLTATW